MRERPEKLAAHKFGPDHCIVCWAYDGNMCGRCLSALIEHAVNAGEAERLLKAPQES